MRKSKWRHLCFILLHSINSPKFEYFQKLSTKISETILFLLGCRFLNYTTCHYKYCYRMTFRKHKESLAFVYLCAIDSIENMEPNKEHIRNVLLFHFNSKKSADQSWKDICTVYGADAVSRSTCFKWFQKFRAGDFSLENEPHASRPREVDDDKLVELVNANPHYTTRELGAMLNVSFQTISTYLKRLKYVNRNGIWVLHEASTNIEKHHQ